MKLPTRDQAMSAIDALIQTTHYDKLPKPGKDGMPPDPDPSPADLTFNPAQPRWPKGTPGVGGQWMQVGSISKGGGTSSQSSRVVQLSPGTEVKNYLNMVSTMQGRGSGQTSSNRAYNGWAQLIQQNAKTYREKLVDHGYPKGEIKQCYKNASRLADNHQNLTYVEGYAISGAVPIPLGHAWVENEQGQVIDVTWPDDLAANENVSEYVGVPVEDDLRRQLQLRSGVFGLFDFQNADLLIENRWEPERLKEIMRTERKGKGGR